MYDIYVNRKGKGLDFVQGRLKNGGTTVKLEEKYKKIGMEMVQSKTDNDNSDNRVDYIQIIEVVDTDEIPPYAPLTRTHYFKYHEDFLKEFEISS